MENVFVTLGVSQHFLKGKKSINKILINLISSKLKLSTLQKSPLKKNTNKQTGKPQMRKQIYSQYQYMRNYICIQNIKISPRNQ